MAAINGNTEPNSPFGNSQAYKGTVELPNGENAKSCLNSMFRQLFTIQ